MAKDFGIKLSTGWCDILIEGVDGYAVFRQSVVVPPKSVNSKNYLNSMCHEVIHISRPDLSEKAVDTLATDIADVLWKRGYRLTKP